MEIIKANYEDVRTEYSYIFNDIFKAIDNNHRPQFVYLGFIEDKFIGFISGYSVRDRIINIQYAGFVDEVRGYYSPLYFKQAIEHIHKEYDMITFNIHNENTRAIKVALNTGFRVYGVRTLEGSTFVEMAKIKESENG